MSEKISLEISESSLKNNSDCHLIPCNIKVSGSANVDQYFIPTISESDKHNNTLLSSFRGRPLIGQKITLPEHCKGLVIESSANTQKLVAKQTFKVFTYWNWDQIPTNSDLIPGAIQWINISKAIHSPVNSKTN